LASLAGRSVSLGTLVGISLLCLATFSALGAAPAAHAASSLVSSADNSCTNCSMVSATVPVGATGEVLAVGVVTDCNCISELTGVSDGLGSTFASAANNGFDMEILTATATGSGSDTVTAQLSSSVSILSIYVYDVSGVTALAQDALNSGLDCFPGPCTTTYSTGSISVISGSFLMSVVADYQNPAFSAGSGFNGLNTGDGLDFSEYSASPVTSTTFPASGDCPSCAAGVAGWWEVGISLPPIPTQVSTPEFPLGAVLLFALLVPAILLLRKRIPPYEGFSA